MLFALDIGNTNITGGIIEDCVVLQQWRLNTQIRRTVDEYMLLFDQLLTRDGIQRGRIKGAAISCVVPSIITGVKAAVFRLLEIEPLIIRKGIKLNFKIKYNPPEHVGADRIVNAAAAREMLGFPCILIDFGTATTFCVIDRDGDYVGGVIFPGVETLSQALYQSAELLPRVTFAEPERLIGNSTASSIQSGLFYGYCDLIDGMIKRLQSDLQGEVPIVITGGLAPILQNSFRFEFSLVPHLTLLGIEIIHKINAHPQDWHKVW